MSARVRLTTAQRNALHDCLLMARQIPNDPSTAIGARIGRSLERLGLVRRAASPPSNVRWYVLTDAGRAALAEVQS